MPKTKALSATDYDTAAPRWGDKMRALGYSDAYQGVLAAFRTQGNHQSHLVDIGCGTASFAEA
ncbi:hypothetical protein [Rhodophyticola porphyridii]|uniref:SAM-dependent methyltransferase n=1 Tax=Rhodophyticola porphyridii TaxID=1852017 RepID=A0A3L9YI32_9RHOB|nr:hypothetical protein [Rhodophyticola porphyridii]RMA42490.1 hypothetical protein D9R08_10400 [Rhodophyticola porphyridii]